MFGKLGVYFQDNIFCAFRRKRKCCLLLMLKGLCTLVPMSCNSSALFSVLLQVAPAAVDRYNGDNPNGTVLPPGDCADDWSCQDAKLVVLPSSTITEWCYCMAAFRKLVNASAKFFPFFCHRSKSLKFIVFW